MRRALLAAALLLPLTTPNSLVAQGGAPSLVATEEHLEAFVDDDLVLTEMFRALVNPSGLEFDFREPLPGPDDARMSAIEIEVDGELHRGLEVDARRGAQIFAAERRSGHFVAIVRSDRDGVPQLTASAPAGVLRLEVRSLHYQRLFVERDGSARYRLQRQRKGEIDRRRERFSFALEIAARSLAGFYFGALEDVLSAMEPLPGRQVVSGALPEGDLADLEMMTKSVGEGAAVPLLERREPRDVADWVQRAFAAMRRLETERPLADEVSPERIVTVVLSAEALRAYAGE